MKKFLIFVVIATLIIGGFGAGALNVVKENTDANTVLNSGEQSTSTHTVLVEYGTATWCEYCKYAHGALKELYSEDQLDFYYISLVTDMNSNANNRAKEYNFYGFPTLWWDGGYKLNLGAGSIPDAKANYTASINDCSSKAVKDVDIDLTAISGGTWIKADIVVTNNEASTYTGTIRVYITEKVSSRGWKDRDGQPYTFPFLDWAFNEPISIPAGGSWSNSMTWGGVAHGYPTLTRENIKLIAAAFNDEKHQGYSYPPSGYPFDAYYVDKVVAIEPGENNPPNKPAITGANKGEPGIEYSYNASTTDPEGEQVYYWFDWGDNKNSGWLGPYASGDICNAKHTWTAKRNYVLKVKAKDTNGFESDWATLSVNIPKNKAYTNALFPNFLKTHPNIFPLLQKILQRLVQ